PLPPSVLVAELLDYLVAAIETRPFSADTRKIAWQSLVVEHPLQPFSLRYFAPGDDARLKSFNDEYCAALKAQLAIKPAPLAPIVIPGRGAALAANEEREVEDTQPEPQGRFFPMPLAGAGPEFREIAFDNFARFFRNPCRYLLDERLGIVLPEGNEELED